MKWTTNGSLFKDYGIVPLEAVDTIYIKKASYEHDGEWSCEIAQEDLNFTWITSLYWVNVKKKPNFLTYVMEDELTKYIFGWMGYEEVVLAAIIFFIVIVVVLVIVGTRFYMHLKKPITQVYEPISTSETE